MERSEERLSSATYLSYSQLADFLTCPHKWLIKYVHGHRPHETSPALNLGSAFHAGIAGLFESGDPRPALDAWYKEAEENWFTALEIPHNFDQTITDAGYLIDLAYKDLTNRGYRLAYGSEVDAAWPRNPLIEKRLLMPLKGTGFHALYGFIDAMVWDANDRLWVLDWKLRKTFQDVEAEETGLQNGIYTALAHYNGFPVAGTITYQISGKPPARPKLNQDGSMSRAKIKTTWPVYMRALIDAGLSPVDYLDMRDALSTTEFVRPLVAFRGPVEIDNMLNQIIRPAAIEMRRHYEDRPAFAPRIFQAYVCNQCSVKSVCLGALRGYEPYQIDTDTAMRPIIRPA